MAGDQGEAEEAGAPLSAPQRGGGAVGGSVTLWPAHKGLSLLPNHLGCVGGCVRERWGNGEAV